MKPEGISQAASDPISEAPHQVDPVAVLREVLELERESRPDLNVDETLAFAEANPDTEVVDSVGAVSVVCVVYGAYSPKNLIPHYLLNHDNFSTLSGLKRVIKELDKRRG